MGLGGGGVWPPPPSSTPDLAKRGVKHLPFLLAGAEEGRTATLGEVGVGLPPAPSTYDIVAPIHDEFDRHCHRPWLDLAVKGAKATVPSERGGPSWPPYMPKEGGELPLPLQRVLARRWWRLPQTGHQHHTRRGAGAVAAKPSSLWTAEWAVRKRGACVCVFACVR